MKKPVIQNHHPDRELYPNSTMPLKKWLHLVVRRIEQMNPTDENIRDIGNFIDAVSYQKLKKILLREAQKHERDKV